MKNLCFVFILCVFIGSFAFSETNAHEEVDYLLFMPNSSNQLANEEQAMIHLDNVARYLMDRNLSPGQIHVHGYTAVAVNDIDSLDLSRDRAFFVIFELQKRGIPETLFADPVAYGEVDFWGSNIDEDERGPNRRVRILLDGHVLTSDTIETFDPIIDSDEEIVQEEPENDESTSKFPWLLLLLIPLIGAILLFRKKPRKKPETSKAVPVVEMVISYTTVNLEDEIRLRAYELFLERNGQNGDAYGDWCKAVIEICTKYEAAGYETYTENGHWLARRDSSYQK